MEKHHSCLNTRAIIQYFQEFFPDKVELLFEGLGPEIECLDNPQEFLMEPNNWVSSEVVMKMFQNARNISQDEDIAFKIGFELSQKKKLGYIQRLLMIAFQNPLSGLKKIQQINDKFNRNKVIEITNTTRNTAVVRLHWFTHIPASLDFCLFNKGIYSGIPKIWNLPPGQVMETKCYFKGDDYCEYHFKWQKSPWKESFLRIFLPWRVLSSTIAEMESDKELLKKKFDEVHRLNLQLKKKVDQLVCLQEASAAALAILNPQELMQVILRLLLNFAKLDRAGIFLLDEKQKVLELHHAAGIAADLFEKVRGYRIPVSKVDNIIARVAMNGIPVVVPDVPASRLRKTNPLLELFKPKVFLLAPLTVRGRVIGVIMADRVSEGATISDADKDFVMSFANQVAIILENAILYRKLEVSERKYRELLENAHDGIWIIDEQGLIKYANRRMRELSGHEVLVGKSSYELFGPDNRGILTEIIAQNRRGKVAQRELDIPSRHNGPIAVIMSSVPVLEDGNFTGAFAMFTDISDKKKMEKQILHQQKMEAIGTLAGGIAHNFNNILMNIMGLVSLMLSETDPSQSSFQSLKQIEQEVEKGANLTKHLLSFARDQQVEVKPTDINALIEKTAGLFHLTRREVNILTKLTTPLPPVEVDQVQLEQVFLNIFLNSWQAMGGKGNILVSSKEVFLSQEFCQPYGLAPGRYVHIAVQDTGVGMDELTRAKIFEPFFTTKEVGEGTGLGLSTAYAIVKNHRGIIEVDSELGKGSTFHIYLPVSHKPVAEEKPQELRYFKGNGTLLLVDDDETIRNLAKEILERLGYNIIQAESGEQALAIFENQQKNIDLVILDLIMPGMGGRETYKKLKEINPEVKILISSGSSLDKEGRSIFAEGAPPEFIQKPYRLEMLSQKLTEMLSS